MLHSWMIYFKNGLGRVLFIAAVFALSQPQSLASNTSRPSNRALDENLATSVTQEPDAESRKTNLPKTPYVAELFTEETALYEAKTLAAFAQVRLGWNLGADWETYFAIRLGGDSRTFLDTSDAVYNDNYAFIGAAVDYKGLAPGVRLVLQVGATQDLNSKIHLGGFDGRGGFTTHHEWRLKSNGLYGEIDSEALYVRRYRNILANIQARTFYSLFNIKLASDFNVEVAPGVIWVGAIDSADLDYNRISELRLGVRLKYKGFGTLMFGPYYVLGTRWKRPTDYPVYRDIRVILTASINF